MSMTKPDPWPWLDAGRPDRRGWELHGGLTDAVVGVAGLPVGPDE